MINESFQSVPERSKESVGGPWIFCGLLPLFDPPRHDSAETIRKALNLGVCVKMITGNLFSLILNLYWFCIALKRNNSFCHRRSTIYCKGDWPTSWHGNKHVPFFIIIGSQQR